MTRLEADPANGRNRGALVVGAGIAGIQASLDMANAGFQVTLVERSPSIGGRMAQLDKTFPTLDCSSCILTPKMADVPRNPNIHLMTCTEVVAVDGQAGNFQVTLQKQPRYVDETACTSCGQCAEVCPVSMPNEFNQGLDRRKAIYRLFPQAVPSAYAIDKRPSPCMSACPAHIPVQAYIALIAQGKFKEALERVRQAGVPFVGTLGRVCYHPCEALCKRTQTDEPLSICALKRFAYDAGKDDTMPEPVPPKWDERVAVVGAGPAGLTAAFDLVRRGYRVTVYDALPVAGGMLAAGIPEYRLPRNVLEHEIDYILAHGVELRLNTPIGRDNGPSMADLQQQYQAVFLAIGAHGSSRMGIPGEDLPGVFQAVPFLRYLNLGYEARIGRRVVIIGGGNSAIDSARCALRMGAQVHLIYRRSRTEMPAASWEVAAAEAEGVKLTFLAAPVMVLEKNGQVAGIKCQRMELGEPDSSGRRRPVPIPGSEFILEVDTIIAAIGQNVEAQGLDLPTQRDRLVVDGLTLQTDQPGVFAGGDAVSGPASVVEAVGSGIQAGESIHRYLRGMDLRAGRIAVWQPAQEISVIPHFPTQKVARAKMPELSILERITSFQEVELGLSASQAVAEAQRCLECAVCCECLQCVSACQRGAIHHNERPQQFKLDVGAIVLATGFEVFDPHKKPELGYGKYPQVITSLEFERLVSASGPTAGKITLNGHPPHRIVFLQCVGSRDRSIGVEYCSRVCCMAVAKQAHLAHDRLPESEITVFYMDVRSYGKGFEEFYDRVRNEGVLYRRGSVSEILRNPGMDNLIVRAEDTLMGELVEVEADLVVLAVGMLPQQDTSDLSGMLNVECGKDGYFVEAHPKLRSVESSLPGIYLAGACQGPKDIPDTVAHAKAAAAAAMILLAKEDAACREVKLESSLSGFAKGAENASN
jgi:heterodisulfide reductase subunit A2